MALGTEYDVPGTRREDLLNIITNIAPVDAPLYNMAVKRTATNMVHSWIVETLAAPTVGGVIDGADVGASDATYAPGTKVSNYTMNIREVYALADGEAEGKAADGKTLLAREIMRKTKQWTRRCEINLMQSTAAAGSASVARTAAGLKAQIVTNVLDNSGVGQNMDETLLLDGLQLVWLQGGDPNVALCHAFTKRQISLFTSNVKNTTAEAKKITTVVNVYESPFGTIELKLSRYNYTAGSPVLCDFYAGQKDLIGVAFKRKTKTVPLGKTGDSTKGYILGELTLEVLNEAGWLEITDLVTA